MKQFRTFDPCTLLSPVPAVMVSCCGAKEEDRPNIITIAWAGTINSNPPMVSISVQKKRFSHSIIRDTGEFVVNLVDEERCRATDYCGVKSGRDVDKFAETGLTPMPALNMKYAPAIAECPAYLSCKVKKIEELGSHDLFIAEVVGVQVRDDLFASDGSLHLENGGLVCYAHGTYLRAQDVLGFFGYSVARPEVYAQRMSKYKK